MTREQVLDEIKVMVDITPMYLMGRDAFHQLGELSRDEWDLFLATGETNGCWLGSWVTGFGFFNVCFPKGTSRKLTDQEVEKYNETYIRLSDHPPQKLNVG